jgi:hypothetical protein
MRHYQLLSEYNGDTYNTVVKELSDNLCEQIRWYKHLFEIRLYKVNPRIKEDEKVEITKESYNSIRRLVLNRINSAE